MAVSETGFEAAIAIRSREIQKFKRDYFIASLDYDYSVDTLDKRATQMAEILYPAVTKENAGDYLNRGF